MHIAELLLVLAVKGQDRGRYISEIQGLSEDVQGTLMQMIQRALADLQGANRQARMRKSVHLRHAATHLEEENAELKKKVKELEAMHAEAHWEKEKMQAHMPVARARGLAMMMSSRKRKSRKSEVATHHSDEVGDAPMERDLAAAQDQV